MPVVRGSTAVRILRRVRLDLHAVQAVGNGEADEMSQYNHPSEINECCGRFLASQDYDVLSDGDCLLCPTCMTQWQYLAGPPSSWKECSAVRTASLLEYTRRA